MLRDGKLLGIFQVIISLFLHMLQLWQIMHRVYYTIFLHLLNKMVWPYPECGHAWTQWALCRVGEEKCRSGPWGIALGCRVLYSCTRQWRKAHTVSSLVGLHPRLLQGFLMGWEKLFFPGYLISRLQLFMWCTGKVTSLDFVLGLPCCCSSVWFLGGILENVTGR